MKSRINLNFTDFLALGIIVACFVLIAAGKNSTVSFVLVSTAAFYFGDRRKRG